jgi:hypothetical protein
MDSRSSLNVLTERKIPALARNRTWIAQQKESPSHPATHWDCWWRERAYDFKQFQKDLHLLAHSNDKFVITAANFTHLCLTPPHMVCDGLSALHPCSQQCGIHLWGGSTPTVDSAAPVIRRLLEWWIAEGKSELHKHDNKLASFTFKISTVINDDTLQSIAVLISNFQLMCKWFLCCIHEASFAYFMKQQKKKEVACIKCKLRFNNLALFCRV